MTCQAMKIQHDMLVRCTRSTFNRFCSEHHHCYFPKDNCAICFEEIDTTQEVPLSCGHWFHKQCLTKLNRNSCPLCRREIVVEDMRWLNNVRSREENRMLREENRTLREEIQRIREENQRLIEENTRLRNINLSDQESQESSNNEQTQSTQIMNVEHAEISNIEVKTKKGLFRRFIKFIMCK